MAQKKADSSLYDLLRDVGGRIGADRVGEILSGLVDGATRSRATLERNLENLLVRVVEGLTASVERLGKRIDDLAVRAAKSAERMPRADSGRRGKPTKNAARASRGTAKAADTESGAATTRKRAVSAGKKKPRSRGNTA